jgi:hypothetical protein
MNGGPQRRVRSIEEAYKAKAKCSAALRALRATKAMRVA